VVSVGARYLAPGRYDDLLSVHARVTVVGGARVRFEYEVTRDEDARLLATGFTDHAVVGRDGRPRRVPDDLRRRLQDKAERT